MLIVIILFVIMLIVIILSVIMLIVVAPFQWPKIFNMSIATFEKGLSTQPQSFKNISSSDAIEK